MYNVGNPSFTATTDLPQYVRVKIKVNSSKVPPEIELAGATDLSIGHTLYSALEENEIVAVRLSNDTGIHEAIVSGPLQVGAELFAAANGKVSDSGTVKLNAISRSAASSDGDVIGIIYL